MSRSPVLSGTAASSDGAPEVEHLPILQTLDRVTKMDSTCQVLMKLHQQLVLHLSSTGGSQNPESSYSLQGNSLDILAASNTEKSSMALFVNDGVQKTLSELESDLASSVAEGRSEEQMSVHSTLPTWQHAAEPQTSMPSTVPQPVGATTVVHEMLQGVDEDFFQLESCILCGKTYDAAVLVNHLNFVLRKWDSHCSRKASTKEEAEDRWSKKWTHERVSNLHLQEEVILNQLRRRLAMSAEDCALERMLIAARSVQASWNRMPTGKSATEGLSQDFESEVFTSKDNAKGQSTAFRALKACMCDFVLSVEQLLAQDNTCCNEATTSDSSYWNRMLRQIRQQMLCTRSTLAQSEKADAHAPLLRVFEKMENWLLQEEEKLASVPTSARNENCRPKAMLALLFVVANLLVEDAASPKKLGGTQKHPLKLKSTPRKVVAASSTTHKARKSTSHQHQNKRKKAFSRLQHALLTPSMMNVLYSTLAEMFREMDTAQVVSLWRPSSVSTFHGRSVSEMWQAHRNVAGEDAQTLHQQKRMDHQLKSTKLLSDFSVAVSTWRQHHSQKPNRGPSLLTINGARMANLEIEAPPLKKQPASDMVGKNRRRALFLQRSLGSLISFRDADLSSQVLRVQGVPGVSAVPPTASPFPTGTDKGLSEGDANISHWVTERFLKQVYTPLQQWCFERVKSISSGSAGQEDEPSSRRQHTDTPKLLILLFRVLDPLESSMASTVPSKLPASSSLLAPLSQAHTELRSCLYREVTSALGAWMTEYIERETLLIGLLFKALQKNRMLSTTIPSVEGEDSHPTAELEGYYLRGEWVSKLYQRLLCSGVAAPSMNDHSEKKGETDPLNTAKPSDALEIESDKEVSLTSARRWLRGASWSTQLPLLEFFLFKTQCLQEEMGFERRSAAPTGVNFGGKNGKRTFSAVLSEVFHMFGEAIHLATVLPQLLGTVHPIGSSSSPSSHDPSVLSSFSESLNLSIANWMVRSSTELLQLVAEAFPVNEMLQWTKSDSPLSNLSQWRWVAIAGRAYDACTLLQTLSFMSVLLKERYTEGSGFPMMAGQSTAAARNGFGELNGIRTRLNETSARLATSVWIPVLTQVFSTIVKECVTGGRITSVSEDLSAPPPDAAQVFPAPPMPRSAEPQEWYNAGLLSDMLAAEQRAPPPSPPSFLSGVSAATGLDQLSAATATDGAAGQVQVDGEVRACVWALASQMIHLLQRQEQSCCLWGDCEIAAEEEGHTGRWRSEHHESSAPAVSREHQLLASLLVSAKSGGGAFGRHSHSIMRGGGGMGVGQSNAHKEWKDTERLQTYILVEFLYPHLSQLLVEFVRQTSSVFTTCVVARCRDERGWEQSLLDVYFLQGVCSSLNNHFLDTWLSCVVKSGASHATPPHSSENVQERIRQIQQAITDAKSPLLHTTLPPRAPTENRTVGGNFGADVALGHASGASEIGGIDVLQWQAAQPTILKLSARKVQEAVLSLGFPGAMDATIGSTRDAAGLTRSDSTAQDWANLSNAGTSTAVHTGGLKQVGRFLYLPLVSSGSGGGVDGLNAAGGDDEPLLLPSSSPRVGTASPSDAKTSPASTVMPSLAALQSGKNRGAKLMQALSHTTSGGSAAAVAAAAAVSSSTAAAAKRHKAALTSTLQRTFEKINPIISGSAGGAAGPSAGGGQSGGFFGNRQSSPTPSGSTTHPSAYSPTHLGEAASVITNVWSSLWKPSSGTGDGSGTSV